jgi:16S rRNA (adenine1518-N6/adenine1519-N6)-dimethyltransferase
MKTSSFKRKGARLGQHFLTGAWAAKKLAEAVGARAGETILEIGPGKGALTKELLKHGPVVAIEKDEALVTSLQETFRDEIASGRLQLIGADVRDITVREPLKTASDARRGEESVRGVLQRTVSTNSGPRNNADDVVLNGAYVVAANIPYYITGEILRHFLTAQHQPRAMALLIQKEVAERIIARNGKESLLSLSVKAYGKPRIVAKVSRGNFSPPPSVDSSIVFIENISRDNFAGTDEKLFFEILHAGFGSKRKQLAGNISKLFDKEVVEKALADCGIEAKARAEDVPLEKWLSVTRAFH